MTIKEYTEAALKFAEASKAWNSLDESQFITTHEGSWEMTADNQNNGVGIEWAFHLDEAAVREKAPEKFLDYIRAELAIAAAGGPETQEVIACLNDLLQPGIFSLAEVK